MACKRCSTAAFQRLGGDGETEIEFLPYIHVTEPLYAVN